MSWTVDVDGAPSQVVNSAVAVANRDKMYCFGDYSCPDLNMNGSMDVKIIQTDNYEWNILKHPNSSSEIPCRRRGHSAVLFNDLVYIWGGSYYHQSFNDLFCFDTNTHLWSKPIVTGLLPTARMGHSACVINDSMYIFAGFDEDNSQPPEFSPQFFQDVHKLDLNSLNWSYVNTKGVPPTYRYKHSATVIKNCMFIFGGLGYADPFYFSPNNREAKDCSEIIYLDTQTLNWIKPVVNGLYRPVGRLGHSSFRYKDQLFIFGGASTQRGSNRYNNELVRYDPDSFCWTIVETRGNRPCPRSGACCCLIGDRVFLFGGYSRTFDESDNSSLIADLKDLHVLDFAPSLKTMAIMAVLEHKLNQKGLPETIQSEIKAMTRQIDSDVTQSSNNGDE